MRTKHWILIFAALAASLSAWCLLRPGQTGLVGIYRDGVLIETVDPAQSRRIELGSAVAIVEDGKIRMETSDCPDQICVEHGPLRPGGTPIVCLPNRLSIQWLQEQGGIDAVSGGR